MQHLRPEDLAKRLKMSVGGLANWRCQGKGPKFLKGCGRILYRKSDVEIWEKKTLKRITK